MDLVTTAWRAGRGRRPRQHPAGGQARELGVGRARGEGRSPCIRQDSDRRLGEGSLAGRSLTSTEKMLNVSNHREIPVTPQGDSASPTRMAVIEKTDRTGEATRS